VAYFKITPQALSGGVWNSNGNKTCVVVISVPFEYSKGPGFNPNSRH
jgi:hypothetical protein